MRAFAEMDRAQKAHDSRQVISSSEAGPSHLIEAKTQREQGQASEKKKKNAPT